MKDVNQSTQKKCCLSSIRTENYKQKNLVGDTTHRAEAFLEQRQHQFPNLLTMASEIMLKFDNFSRKMDLVVTEPSLLTAFDHKPQLMLFRRSQMRKIETLRLLSVIANAKNRRIAGKYP